MSRSHSHAANPITFVTRLIRSLIILCAELVMGLVVIGCFIYLMLSFIFN